MDHLTYARLLREEDTDIPELIKVYRTPEIAQYISISDNYFRYVTNSEDIYFYKIYAGNRLIGATHLEIQETVLYMDLLIFPEFQKLGWGTKVVKDIQNDVFGLGFEKIEIAVDEKNTASLRLFENMGFVCISKEEELLNLVYQSVNSL